MLTAAPGASLPAVPSVCTGFLHAEARRYEEGIAAFQTALRGGVSDAAAWEGLGACYHSLGRFTAALKAYTRALELEGGRLYSRAQCGAIRLTLGDYAEGLREFERYAGEAPLLAGSRILGVPSWLQGAPAPADIACCIDAELGLGSEAAWNAPAAAEKHAAPLLCLLRRALELDPQHPAALLGAAETLAASARIHIHLGALGETEGVGLPSYRALA